MGKRTITILALVLVAALSLFALTILTRPSGQTGSKAVTVEVHHLEGGDKSFKLRTDAEFLRQLLEENDLASGSETQYGLWIQTVDGETADDSKQQWWGISVNGQFAEYGADSQPVADGDVFELTLNEGY
ncbi:MAG: DUF4430 domain-containing protein [Firmicutes bacterium]|nr:DUF4430 domain-containing protein [Bacillota bacterium]